MPASVRHHLPVLLFVAVAAGTVAGAMLTNTMRPAAQLQPDQVCAQDICNGNPQCMAPVVTVPCNDSRCNLGPCSGGQCGDGICQQARGESAFGCDPPPTGTNPCTGHVFCPQDCEEGGGDLTCADRRRQVDLLFDQSRSCVTSADCAVYMHPCSPYLTCGKAVAASARSMLSQAVDAYAAACPEQQQACAGCIQQTATCEQQRCVLQEPQRRCDANSDCRSDEICSVELGDCFADPACPGCEACSGFCQRRPAGTCQAVFSSCSCSTRCVERTPGSAEPIDCARACSTSEIDPYRPYCAFVDGRCVDSYQPHCGDGICQNAERESSNCPRDCEDNAGNRCYDSDNGENYFSRGIVKLTGENSAEFKDECRSDAVGSIFEFFCNSRNGVERRSFFCVNGCENGACNSIENIKEKCETMDCLYGCSNGLCLPKPSKDVPCRAVLSHCSCRNTCASIPEGQELNDCDITCTKDEIDSYAPECAMVGGKCVDKKKSIVCGDGTCQTGETACPQDCNKDKAQSQLIERKIRDAPSDDPRETFQNASRGSVASAFSQPFLPDAHPAADDPPPRLFPDTDSEAASRLAQRGIISGYPDGTFQESRKVNRAELLKFIVNALDVVVPEKPADAAPFKDVPADAWYVPYLEFAVREEIITGYTDDTFRPANEVTTSEFLAIVTRAFELPRNYPYGYSDVPDDAWYIQFAGLAERFSLFSTRTSRLLPDQPLTRLEVAEAIDTILQIFEE